MITVLQNGLESIRAVNVFGRQDLEEDRLKKISLETVHAALKARRIKSFIAPVFTLAVAVCTAFVLWRGASLAIAGLMTVGALTGTHSANPGSRFDHPSKTWGKRSGNIERRY